MSTWTNWSRLETARPTREATPADAGDVVAEVRRALETASTVKMVGTGHSFTAISAPEATMLRPEGLTGIVGVDHDALTVTARAGTPLKVLNAELEALGLSLHNMGDIAEQTLAGAISTGTHGTGGIAAGLAAQVVGLELVTGTGELLRATPERERRRPRRGPGRARRARDPDHDHVPGRAGLRAGGARSSRCRGTRRSTASTT